MSIYDVVPLYTPLTVPQVEALVAAMTWPVAATRDALLLAAREGARVHVGDCQACIYVFVGGAITPAAREAIRASMAVDPFFGFTGPDASDHWSIAGHRCVGGEVYSLCA